MLTLFNKVKEKYSIVDIAKLLNVAPGTVSRWNTQQKVPESYRFDLMKLAGEKINYTQFGPKDKDQFFTPSNVAQHCVEVVTQTLEELDINIEDYIFIEPSAGSGRFLPYMPTKNYIAMDVEPFADNIIEKDFLDWQPDPTKKYIVIGNPPFGLRGQKALQFINKSFEFADFVCFILPPLFNSDGKGSPKKRIEANLIVSEDIASFAYSYPDGESVNINTIFQIWSKLDVGINLNEIYTPIGYKIYSLSDGGTPSTTRNKDKLYSCDYYLPSTVFGTDKMKLYDNFEALPQRRGYGIIVEDKTLNTIIENINWTEVAFYSTNNAINLRTSLITKAIELKK
jgi:hypothetical protein